MSEELARRVEDSLRQQEEISSLLGQIVDLELRCKGVRQFKNVKDVMQKLPKTLHCVFLIQSTLFLP